MKQPLGDLPIRTELTMLTRKEKSTIDLLIEIPRIRLSCKIYSSGDLPMEIIKVRVTS